MVSTPLHHIFLRSLYRPEAIIAAQMPTYKARLQFMRRELIESQRFSLDTKAVWEIVDRSDLNIKHLMDRVQLAHLPFDKIWLEYNQHDKIEANFYAGRGPRPDMEAVAPLAGFLMKRLDDRPNAWVAQKIQAQSEAQILPKHGCDMFEYIFDGGSVYPIANIDGHRTVLNDGFFSSSPEDIATTLWGGAALHKENDPLDEALNKGSLGLNSFWRAQFESSAAKNVLNKAEYIKTLVENLEGQMMEMVGELRFLVTALAVMNEVPIIISDDVRPARLTFLAGGKMQPYLSHRTVSINVPAIKKKQKTVEEILYEAGSKKRRHKVRRHRRTYLNADGSIKNIKWIEEHERGDAALGYVTHDYDVTSKGRKTIG
jgi:hypothetical protein